MTPILQVLTEYCAPYVDDVRLCELAVTDPPLYARRLWGYLRPQMARFTLPSGMPEYLYGTPEAPALVEPRFNAARYTQEQQATSPVTVDLGAEYAGYELFACRTVSRTALGEVVARPTDLAQYDAATGQITLAASEDAPIPAGTVFDFDFYTDGSFANTLSPEVMTVLGMCFEIGWTTRFENDYLSYVDKVEDKSFSEQNRANRMRAGDDRLVRMEHRLAGAMRRLESRMYETALNPPQPPVR